MTEIPSDLIDAVAGIAPGSRLDLLRRERSDIRRHIQGTHEALFSPDNAFGLSLAERYAAAFHAARLNASAGLAAHYHEQLTCFPGAVSAAQIEAGTSDETRLAAILRHTALMTETPDEGTPKALAALTAERTGDARRRGALSTRCIRELSDQTAGGPLAVGGQLRRSNVFRDEQCIGNGTPQDETVTRQLLEIGCTGGCAWPLILR